MDRLPTKFILTIKPQQYLKQGFTHCGVYSAKAILSAFGKDIKNHPKEYHTNWIGRNLFSFARGKDYIDRIFRLHGVESETKSAQNLSDKQKLELLKKLLFQNRPVMIGIGNGYIFSNKYNPVIGKILQHWITLWGYDDNKQIFYVYDSALKRKYWDKTLPVGNTTRTYKEILRDWNFGAKQPWAWNISSKNSLYVEIKGLI